VTPVIPQCATQGDFAMKKKGKKEDKTSKKGK
jgi:hypothetical protein